MADKVSNVSSGVDSGRQAPAASGAGSGRKDDKKGGRKPPRKNPSRVGKYQAMKRCFICNQPGHLKKDCPLAAVMSSAYNMMINQIVQLTRISGPPPRANSAPRRFSRPTSRSLGHGEGRAVQRGSQMQLDAREENGAEQQQQQQQPEEQQPEQPQQQEQQPQEQLQQAQTTLPERSRDRADDDAMDMERTSTPHD